MNKLFYNPTEIPEAVRLESKLLGVNKQYECFSGQGPVWMSELFKLAATDSFDKVEVLLTAHNQAYYRNRKNPAEKTTVVGWVSLKDYKDSGGYLNDRYHKVK